MSTADDVVESSVPRSTAKAVKAGGNCTPPTAVRLDFTQSDKFRTRVGSIVRKSANAVPDESGMSFTLVNLAFDSLSRAFSRSTDWTERRRIEALLNSLKCCFYVVNSSAGVLMSSLGSNGGALTPIDPKELKEVLDAADKSAKTPQQSQQAKGATLPRDKGTAVPPNTTTPDASSQTKSQSASTASLFR